MSVAELEATLDNFRVRDLARVEATESVVKFILNPPFNFGGRIFYRLIANAAIATIDPNELKILGPRAKSKVWLKLARFFLDIFRLILGPESPSQSVARERIARITSQ